MPTLRIWIGLLATAFLLGHPADGSRPSPPGGTPSIVRRAVEEADTLRDLEDTSRRIFELTNRFREEQGRRPLRWDGSLHQVACEHNRQMFSQGFFDHFSPDGRGPSDRVGVGGRRLVAGRSVAENLNQWRGSSPTERHVNEVARSFMQSWKDSPGHRKNMLNDTDTHLGVCVTAGENRAFAGQLFATVRARLDEPLPSELPPGGRMVISMSSYPPEKPSAVEYDWWDAEEETGVGRTPFQGAVSAPESGGRYRLRFYFPSGGAVRVRAWGPALSITRRASPSGRVRTSDLEITYPPLGMTSLTYGVVGQQYVTELRASEPTDEVIWTLRAGSLPDGLTLGSDGEIAGTPTRAGTSSFTVQVESGEEITRRELSLAVVERSDRPWTAVSAGLFHTCGITEAGGAFCWGENRLGQLGTGAEGRDRSEPVRVSGDHSWKSLSAGSVHTCGITEAGEAFCWGREAPGPLGTGSRSIRTAPVPVAGGRTWRSLSAGRVHTCGVTEAGEAFCWGRNRGGQLGIGSLGGTRAEPARVAGDHSWRSISTGRYHTCGITEDGEAFCWGVGTFGQLGNGSTSVRSRPVRVAGGRSWRSLSAGRVQTCGITEAGKAFCWGRNRMGQLGSGSSGGDRAEPVPVAGDHSWTSVTVQDSHACGVSESGAAFCWGDGGDHLANGSLSNRTEPVRVWGGHPWASVSTGNSHTCGVTDAGEAFCWGGGTSGQVGDGSTAVRAKPVPVSRP